MQRSVAADSNRKMMRAKREICVMFDVHIYCRMMMIFFFKCGSGRQALNKELCTLKSIIMHFIYGALKTAKMSANLSMCTGRQDAKTFQTTRLLLQLSIIHNLQSSFILFRFFVNT